MSLSFQSCFLQMLWFEKQNCFLHKKGFKCELCALVLLMCTLLWGTDWSHSKSLAHRVLQRWPWLSSLCISCRSCCPQCSTMSSWCFMYFSPKAVLGPPWAAFFSSLFLCSFSYNSLFCRQAEGFARCGSRLRCGIFAGRMPSVISSVTSMKGRLKSGHRISLSFCYISVSLKKFE